MALRALWGTLAGLQREHTALRSSLPVEDHTASFEVAASARDFSRRTKETVDDKLSFSATLMRAGEVGAANRLLVELERDVRTEEAALLEHVNEVRTARAVHHHRLTRVRAARTLAAAALGAILMATSAFGVTLAAAVQEDDDGSASKSTGAPVHADSAPSLAAAWTGQARVRRVRVGDVRLELTRSEFRRYRRLISGPVNDRKLESFLQSVLPARLVPIVKRAIVASLLSAPQSPGAVSLQIEVPDVEPPARAAGAGPVVTHVRSRVENAAGSAQPPDHDETSRSEPSDQTSSGGEPRAEARDEDGGGRESDGTSQGSGEELGGELPPLPGI